MVTIDKNRLKKLREEKGISQEELAATIKCSQQTIYRYENYKSPISNANLKSLSSYFNVNTDYLLDLSDKKSNNVNEGDEFKSITSRLEDKCDNKDEYYYVIFRCGDLRGGQTCWTDFTEDGREVRVLRKYTYNDAIRLCFLSYGYPILIDSIESVNRFLNRSQSGAIISVSDCEKYLPEYLELFID
mgnify:CR=1 FL=1